LTTRYIERTTCKLSDKRVYRESGWWGESPSRRNQYIHTVLGKAIDKRQTNKRQEMERNFVNFIEINEKQKKDKMFRLKPWKQTTN